MNIQKNIFFQTAIIIYLKLIYPDIGTDMHTDKGPDIGTDIDTDIGTDIGTDIDTDKIANISRLNVN